MTPYYSIDDETFEQEISKQQSIHDSFAFHQTKVEKSNDIEQKEWLAIAVELINENIKIIKSMRIRISDINDDNTYNIISLHHHRFLQSYERDHFEHEMQKYMEFAHELQRKVTDLILQRSFLKNNFDVFFQILLKRISLLDSRVKKALKTAFQTALKVVKKNLREITKQIEKLERKIQNQRDKSLTVMLDFYELNRIFGIVSGNKRRRLDWIDSRGKQLEKLVVSFENLNKAINAKDITNLDIGRRSPMKKLLIELQNIDTAEHDFANKLLSIIKVR